MWLQFTLKISVFAKKTSEKTGNRCFFNSIFRHFQLSYEAETLPVHSPQGVHGESIIETVMSCVMWLQFTLKISVFAKKTSEKTGNRCFFNSIFRHFQLSYEAETLPVVCPQGVHGESIIETVMSYVMWLQFNVKISVFAKNPTSKKNFVCWKYMVHCFSNSNFIVRCCVQ